VKVIVPVEKPQQQTSYFVPRNPYLFRNLELTRLNNPPAWVAELVNVEATEIIIIQGNGEFGWIGDPRLIHFTAHKIVDLQAERPVNGLVESKIDIAGGRVRIEMGDPLSITKTGIGVFISNKTADEKRENQ
jgi:hypothetical protein